MKTAFTALILLQCLLFQTACGTASVSRAEQSSVVDSPQSRMETWFRFHSTLLDDMRKCSNYNELTLQDDWARGVREGIRRDIHEWSLSGHERAEFLRRLRIAGGEANLAYVDTFSALRSARMEELVYIRWVIGSIDRSMNLWDEPETVLLRSAEVGVCFGEAMTMSSDARGFGLESEFSACVSAASDATKRSVTLLSQGPKIREHLGRKRK